MSILDGLIPTSSEDVTAIIDSETGEQMFAGARPMKISVDETSKLMVHPREDGSTQIDHKIDLPINIQIPMILESESYRDVYAEFRDAKINGTELTIQTKTFTHENMFIEAIPREEDPKYFSTITMVIRLTQALIFNTEISELSVSNVSDPSDSSTVGRGQVNGTNSSDSEGTALSRLLGGFL